MRVERGDLRAELRDGRAVDLREADLEQDLLERRRLERIDHLRAGSPRDLECPLRDHRAAHLPRQRHGVPTGRHHDLLPREQAAQVALQPGCVRRDLDREEVQAPRAVPDEQARRPQLPRVDDDLPLRDELHVHHVRVADRDARDRAGMLVQSGPALGHRNHPLRLREHPLGPGRAGHHRGEQEGRKEGTRRSSQPVGPEGAVAFANSHSVPRTRK